MATVATLWSTPALGQQQRGIVGNVKIRGRATLDSRVQVTLLSNDRRPYEHTFTDDLGAFQFLGLGPGAYYLVIQEPGFQRIEELVEVPTRSITLQRRYYVLEPQPTAAQANNLSSPVAVADYLIPKEARESFEKGERELKKRKIESAARFLDRALAIAPDFGAALHARGLLCLQQNDLVCAHAFFQKAVSATPQLGDAHIGLGAALVRMGQLEDALEPLAKGLSLNPSSFLGSFERCRAYMHLNRLSEAEQDCIHARELAGKEDLSLHVLLGNLYLRQGKEKEALAEFELYLDKDSESPTAAAIRDEVQKLRKTAGKSPR